MKKWRLYNDYDRPIPRRIIESNGVPRQMFGQIKRGGGLSFAKNFTKRQLKHKMTAEGYEDFIIWLNKKGNNSWSIKRILAFFKYHLTMLPEYVVLVISKILPNRFNLNYKDTRKKTVNPGLPSRLIIWGIEVIKDRYMNGLQN